jgi:hypothetical protein
MKALILALVAVVAGAQTPTKGPRGGCYIVKKSKTGHEYKKYVPCKEAK